MNFPCLLLVLPAAHTPFHREGLGALPWLANFLSPQGAAASSPVCMRSVSSPLLFLCLEPSPCAGNLPALARQSPSACAAGDSGSVS